MWTNAHNRDPPINKIQMQSANLCQSYQEYPTGEKTGSSINSIKKTIHIFKKRKKEKKSGP